MKHSVAISLAILGSGIALTSCSEEKQVDAAAYARPEQCVADGRYAKEDCEADYRTAVADFEKSAPAFKDLKDCEKEFDGQCQPAPANHPAGGGNFIPFMQGYLMGSHMASTPVAVAPQALYRSRSASALVNGEGTPVSRSMGSFRLSTNRSAFAAPAPARTAISRGGFGSRSFSISA